VAATLKITGPAGVTEVPLLDNSTWKIGREPSCTVVLNDDAVSRRHAMVQQTEKDEYYLIDLGSRNGTFLNEVRVSTPSMLANGDQIRVGMHHLAFQSDSTLPRYVEQRNDDTEGATRPMYAPRTVTVLVVDVRGYTKLAQAIDHTILCQLIGTWFREASQIMDKYGSWAQQYIGDAVMAVWLHDDPANRQKQMMRILRAYAEFARATQKLQQKFQLPCPFRIGAGINTGLAQVGNTGTGAQTNYTAVGDAVVAAFRIETCTRQIDCDLAIGTATLEAIGAPAKYFEKHSVELKGFDKPTTVWSTSFPAIEDLLATAAPDAGSGRTTSPITGA
jgi:adenylate cyclase